MSESLDLSELIEVMLCIASYTCLLLVIVVLHARLCVRNLFLAVLHFALSVVYSYALKCCAHLRGTAFDLSCHGSD